MYYIYIISTYLNYNIIILYTNYKYIIVLAKFVMYVLTSRFMIFLKTIVFNGFQYLFFRYRGRLISYNEFLPKDTVVELLDVCLLFKTKLENLYILPYYLKYGPLVSFFLLFH